MSATRAGLGRGYASWRILLRTSIDKLRAEEHVGVLEHALLERHDDELRVLEVVFDHRANILCVAQVERRIHLVQNVHRCRFEEQQRKDQRERQQGPEFRQMNGSLVSIRQSSAGGCCVVSSVPLAAAQLREALLPHAAQRDTHGEAVKHLRMIN